MRNLCDLPFEDVEAIYHFLELRKDMVANDPNLHSDRELENIRTMQKAVSTELYSRIIDHH